MLAMIQTQQPRDSRAEAGCNGEKQQQPGNRPRRRHFNLRSSLNSQHHLKNVAHSSRTPDSVGSAHSAGSLAGIAGIPRKCSTCNPGID